MPIRAFPLELKQLSAEVEGEFEGFASVYGIEDLGHDVVQKGAFTTSIAQQGATRPLLYSHTDPVGTVELVDTPTGLAVKGKLTMAVQKARDVYALMKDGAIKGLSIGFQSIPGSDQVRDGKRFLTNLKLFEVSLTWAPMCEQAVVTSVKQQQFDEEEQARQTLRDFQKEIKTLLDRRRK